MRTLSLSSSRRRASGMGLVVVIVLLLLAGLLTLSALRVGLFEQRGTGNEEPLPDENIPAGAPPDESTDMPEDSTPPDAAPATNT